MTTISLRSERGESLLTVLVAIGILGTFSVALSKVMANQMQAQDLVRADVETAEIDWVMRLVLQRRSTCAKSGLLGVQVDPANPGSALLEIHTPGANGPGPVYLKEGEKAPGSKWKTASLRFASLVGVGSGNYFATLRLAGAYRGGANSSNAAIANKTLTRDYHVDLSLDSSNRIASCGSNTTKSAFRVGKNAVRQVIPANSWTLISWPVEAFDLAGEFAANRFVVTTPGVYQLHAQVMADDFISANSNGADQARIAIYRNGVSDTGGRIEVSYGGLSDMTMSVDATVKADVGDYFQVYMWHDESSMTIQTQVGGTNNVFSGHLIAGP